MENDVYFDENNPSVLTKINNLRTTGGNPMLYLDYVAMFNGVFKEAPIKVIGFTKLSNGDVGIVTQQNKEDGEVNDRFSEYVEQNNVEDVRGQINNRRNEDVSKVVDENGEPKVVYHGTNAEFNTFDQDKIGSATDYGIRGRGFYFSPNKNLVSMNYGSKVMDTFLSIRNPFDPFKFSSQEEIAEHLGIDESIFTFTPNSEFKVYSPYAGTLTSSFRDKGYDGVLYPKRMEIVAFDPNQIKSAKDNVGTFSRENNDIRFLFGNTNNVSEEQINEAERLEQEGKTEQEIVKEVGVIKTPNNKWVPVIDNNIQSIISNEEVNKVVKTNKLRDGGEKALIDNGVKLDFEKVFKFDELFKHYPEFKDKIEVLLYEDKRKIPQNEGGFAYLSKRGSLGIAIQAGGNSKLSIRDKNEGVAQFERVYPTVLHEIQHLIQFTNGEVIGTHPSIIYDELIKGKMQIYDAKGNRINLDLLADSYIEQGLAKDINDFYMRLSMDLYNSFLGEVNARAAETNSYTNVLSEVGIVLFPVSENEYILSDERLDIIPYIKNKQSNLGSSIIGEKGAGKVAAYYENLQTAKRYEKQGRTPEYIEEKTGWYKVKGEWKMISNEVVSQFAFKEKMVFNKPLTLKETIKDNLLFTLYPELKNIKVILANENYKKFPEGFNKEEFFNNNNGVYQESEIYLNFSKPQILRLARLAEKEGYRDNHELLGYAVKETLKTLAHETQHVIQKIERSAEGGSYETLTS